MKRESKIDGHKSESLYFDTMANAAAATKYSLRTLRDAKKAGCPAFEGSSRVRLMPLIRWLNESSGGEEGEDYAPRLTKEKFLRERIKRRKDERAVILKTEVLQCLAKMLSTLFGTIDRQNNAELPQALVGLTAFEIQQVLVKARSSLRAEFGSEMQRLAAEESAESKEEKEDE